MKISITTFCDVLCYDFPFLFRQFAPFAFVLSASRKAPLFSRLAIYVILRPNRLIDKTAQAVAALSQLFLSIKKHKIFLPRKVLGLPVVLGMKGEL